MISAASSFVFFSTPALIFLSLKTTLSFHHLCILHCQFAVARSHYWAPRNYRCANKVFCWLAFFYSIFFHSTSCHSLAAWQLCGFNCFAIPFARCCPVSASFLKDQEEGVEGRKTNRTREEKETKEKIFQEREPFATPSRCVTVSLSDIRFAVAFTSNMRLTRAKYMDSVVIQYKRRLS